MNYTIQELELEVGSSGRTPKPSLQSWRCTLVNASRIVEHSLGYQVLSQPELHRETMS